MNRTIKVAIEGPHTAFISGYGTREVLTELRGRPPLWSSRERAWTTTESTAMDLLAYAEQHNWNIVLTGSAEASGLVKAAWKTPAAPDDRGVADQECNSSENLLW